MSRSNSPEIGTLRTRKTKTGDAEPSANWGSLLTRVMQVRLPSAEPIAGDFGILLVILVL